MSPERLSILYVSHIPPSPPRFGAQARVHGLMTQLARRHDLSNHPPPWRRCGGLRCDRGRI